jgi:lipid-A-disaccharide synthase
MLTVVDNFPDYQFVIVGAPSQEYLFYETFITSSNTSLSLIKRMI